jgi:AraC-like DNA-binding protein
LSSTIYIKSMVCVRCKMAVQAVLEQNSIPYLSIELGWAKLHRELTPAQRKSVQQGLKAYQLEMVEDKNRILAERIKAEIISILQSQQPLQFKLSVHLSELLDYNYTYLANTFSAVEGITVERYFIAQRVEKVKEMIVYDDLSLTEITDQLRYSSVSHLCLQFKKVAGITPAEFRKRCRSDHFIWKAI